ncbi:MAG: pat [Lacunisphaera sp.]|nr:pat [Lacunisphaera sp.]
MLRSATSTDAAAIAAIYNHYVLTTIITFEEEAVTETDMAGRIRETLATPLPWFVWEENRRVLGYAYASKWKSRCAYRYAVEASVYLDQSAIARGLGTKLYSALIADVKARGMHAIIGGAALPNPASVALHEKLGFTKIGQFKEVGWKFEKWIDVGYWELIL